MSLPHSITNDFVHLRSEHQSQLHSNSDQEEHEQRHLNESRLDIDLDHSDSSVPVKSLPSIAHANHARSTDDLGDNLATEGTVEGNNRLIILGEKRSLYTGIRDVDREAQDHREEDRDCNEKSGGEADGGELHLAHVLENKRVADISIQSKTIVHLGRYVDTQLLNDGTQGGWGSKFLKGRSRWNALSQGLGARLADHGVDPGGVEASEDDVEAGHDDDGEGDAVADQGRGGHGEDVHEENVQREELEALEAGEEASTGAEMSNGRAEVGGYGFLLDEEEFLLDAVCEGDFVFWVQKGGVRVVAVFPVFVG